MTLLRAKGIGFGGGVSDAYTTPFPHTPGTRARDSDGNEYVFCTAGEPVAPEMIVVISPSWDVTKLTTTSRGIIGVAPDYAKLGQSANSPTMHSSYQWSSDN